MLSESTDSRVRKKPRELVEDRPETQPKVVILSEGSPGSVERETRTSNAKMLLIDVRKTVKSFKNSGQPELLEYMQQNKWLSPSHELTLLLYFSGKLRASSIACCIIVLIQPMFLHQIIKIVKQKLMQLNYLTKLMWHWNHMRICTALKSTSSSRRTDGRPTKTESMLIYFGWADLKEMRRSFLFSTAMNAAWNWRRVFRAHVWALTIHLSKYFKETQLTQFGNSLTVK